MKIINNYYKRTNKILDKYLNQQNEPKNLCAAMRYAVLNGGKRLRPILVYIVGNMYGANIKALDAPACAIELIHSFSLVHDDLPAMDNDDLRRGKPTCHKKFDEATAILAGDALAISAFQVINNSKYLAAKQIVAMSNVLALASGPAGMAGGQDIDMQATGEKMRSNKIEQMYILKTGALLVAAVKLGAVAANIYDKKELKLLEQIAQNIGLAFQIQDDIFNIEGDVVKLGKNTKTDKKNQKTTYPELVGMKKAKQKVAFLWEKSTKNMQYLQTKNQLLQDFIGYLANRNY
jgi:geranylgeranyl pyrophosphate synthase